MGSKKLIVSVLLMLFANLALAQNDKNKMSDTQKAQAAKADVYIINSKKKIKDSITTTRDTTATLKSSKKKCGTKRNKKSS